jgi:hypothetical protein
VYVLLWACDCRPGKSEQTRGLATPPVSFNQLELAPDRTLQRVGRIADDGEAAAHLGAVQREGGNNGDPPGLRVSCK